MHRDVELNRPHVQAAKLYPLKMEASGFFCVDGHLLDG